ncbi:MAG: hypothetical protein GW917_01970 [Bdellovibrionales bacterium]|nr:hypothetical protein [Bdellovibrionales bacterium]
MEYFPSSRQKNVEGQLRSSICQSLSLSSCDQISDEDLLSQSVGMFKTPSLRSLGQSAPYFSNGSAPDLKEVLHFYMMASELTKRDRLLNGDPILRTMHFRPHHFGPIEALLQALDEDYE